MKKIIRQIEWLCGLVFEKDNFNFLFFLMIIFKWSLLCIKLKDILFWQKIYFDLSQALIGVFHFAKEISKRERKYENLQGFRHDFLETFV